MTWARRSPRSAKSASRCSTTGRRKRPQVFRFEVPVAGGSRGGDPPPARLRAGALVSLTPPQGGSGTREKQREFYTRRSRKRFFLVIPLRPPASARPPSSFRRKPESRGHLSPRPRRKPVSILWIPAFAGMTTGWDLQVCNSQNNQPEYLSKSVGATHPVRAARQKSFPITPPLSGSRSRQAVRRRRLRWGSVGRC